MWPDSVEVCKDENIRVLCAPPEDGTSFNLFYLRRNPKYARCDIAGKLNYRATGIEIFCR
jgi:hypothetical protein